MKLANTCPKCHSTANFFVIDTDGKSYYCCSTSTTSLKLVENIRHELVSAERNTWFVPCDTIIDNQGQVVHGTIVWTDGHNEHRLQINHGKLVGEKVYNI